MHKNPLLYLFRKTWQYSKGNRIALVASWAMFVCAQLTTLLMFPLTMGKAISILQAEGATPQNIYRLDMFVILAAVSGLGFWIFHGPGRYIEENNSFQVRISYRKQLLQGIMTMPLKWWANNHSGDIIDKMDKGANGLFNFAGNAYEIVYAGVALVVFCIMLCYVSLSSFLIFAVMLVVVWYIIGRFDRVIVPKYRELNRKENNIAERIQDAINAINTVITLRVERLIFETIVRHMEEPYELWKSRNRVSETKWWLTGMCSGIMMAIVFIVYMHQHMGAPNLKLGSDAVLLLLYLSKVGELFNRLTGKYGEIQEWRAKVANAELLSTQFKPENFTNHVLPEEWQRLDIEELSFSHSDDGEALHLDNVAFTIHRGRKIALVGAKGSGKTTFLKVMRQLFDEMSLKLSVDGKVIEEGFGGISRAMTLVLQETDTFSDTCLYNITMGADYPPELVQHYIGVAEFAGVAAKLPHGVQT